MACAEILLGGIWIFCNFENSGKLFKKQAKNIVFEHFRENFHKKNVFFRRVPPPPKKIVLLAPKVPLEKFWGWSAKNGCAQIIPKGDPLKKIGNQGWKESGRLRTPFPRGTLLVMTFIGNVTTHKKTAAAHKNDAKQELFKVQDSSKLRKTKFLYMPERFTHFSFLNTIIFSLHSYSSVFGKPLLFGKTCTPEWDRQTILF